MARYVGDLHPDVTEAQRSGKRKKNSVTPSALFGTFSVWDLDRFSVASNQTWVAFFGQSIQEVVVSNKKWVAFFGQSIQEVVIRNKNWLPFSANPFKEVGIGGEACKHDNSISSESF